MNTFGHENQQVDVFANLHGTQVDLVTWNGIPIKAVTFRNRTQWIVNGKPGKHQIDVTVGLPIFFPVEVFIEWTRLMLGMLSGKHMLPNGVSESFEIVPAHSGIMTYCIFCKARESDEPIMAQRQEPLRLEHMLH